MAMDERATAEEDDKATHKLGQFLKETCPA